MKQIEILEEQGDTAGFAEEMKRIYHDRDSYKSKSNDKLSQSDKLANAKNKLALSAQKFVNRSRKSISMAMISEELGEEEDSLVISDNSGSKQKAQNSKSNRTGSLIQSMKEKETTKFSQIDSFMDKVLEKGDEIPTMEDLAGTSLVKQIEAQEDQ